MTLNALKENIQQRNGCKSIVTLPHVALAASLLQLGTYWSLLKATNFSSFIRMLLDVSIQDKIIAVSYTYNNKYGEQGNDRLTQHLLLHEKGRFSPPLL